MWTFIFTSAEKESGTESKAPRRHSALRSSWEWGCGCDAATGGGQHGSASWSRRTRSRRAISAESSGEQKFSRERVAGASRPKASRKRKEQEESDYPSDPYPPVFYRREDRGRHGHWTLARAPRTQTVPLGGGAVPAEGMGAGGAVLRAQVCPWPKWCGQLPAGTERAGGSLLPHPQRPLAART